MATTRQPNHRLARVLEQVGLSNKGLASRVRAAAERRGIDASPDHVFVRRWLEGVRPRDEMIRCIAAVLSAEQDREVPPAEIGYDLPPKPVQADIVEDSVHYLAKPGRAVELLDALTSVLRHSL